MDEHGGALPRDRETLETLPGLGRSTAAAVAAQAFDRPEAILDGNAKRVIARHAGIEGWPGERVVEQALWREAEARMPLRRAADYTQAIMDLGSGLCLRRQPRCGECPVRGNCSARLTERTADIPAPRPKRNRPRRPAALALLRDPAGRILLVRRPPAGIWGGLWSLPQAEDVGALQADYPQARNWRPDGRLEHGFTHFILTAELHTADIDTTRIDTDTNIADGSPCRWLDPLKTDAYGLPAPIRQLVGNLAEDPDSAG